ncbi:MAG: hypothetical protein DMG21_12490 [Acidobacteria bacterium]|nr:MAG: hypothetical protein DMG21_12490 [Acidobacteriota bacterium]
MRNALTIRLPRQLAAWLEETSRKTGLPAGRIVREQLERARKLTSKPRVLSLAGRISGSRRLSSRKGFAER